MQVNSCSQLLVGPVFSCLFGSWFSCSWIQLFTIMFMASSELMTSLLDHDLCMRSKTKRTIINPYVPFSSNFQFSLKLDTTFQF